MRVSCANQKKCYDESLDGFLHDPILAKKEKNSKGKQI